MISRISATPVALAFGTFFLAACQAAQPTLGQGGTMVSGSGGQAGALGASAQLERCDRPLGTVALVENDIPGLAQRGLESPVPLIRLMMQQSGCFRVVDRGQAMDRIERERALAAGGTLRPGSNLGGGQMVAADYLVTPNVIFSDHNAGRTGGALGARLPGIAGFIAGGIRMTDLQAETMLSLTDVRTGVQEAVASGSAHQRDIGFGLGGLGLASLPLAGIGGSYASTDQGKVVAAAFLDAYSKLVAQVRAMRPGIAAAAAGKATSASLQTPFGRDPIPVIAEAGVAYQAVSTLNLRAGPSTDDRIIGKVPARAFVEATGQEENGWFRVDHDGRVGWVAARNLRLP